MTKWILTLVLALTLAGCDLDMKSSEVLFRHDPKEDTMRVLFVHRDITAKDPKEGSQQLQKLLKGERTFMLGFFPFYVRLEEEVKNAEERIEKNKETKTLSRRQDLLMVAIGKRVRVVEAKLGTDADGTLVGWQEVMISEWSKFLSDFNQCAKKDDGFKSVSRDGDGRIIVEVLLSTKDKINILHQIKSSPETFKPIIENLMDVATTADGVRLKFGKARGAAIGVRVDATSDPNKKRSGEDQWIKRTPEDRVRLNEALKVEGVVLERVDADAKIRSMTGEKAPVDDAK